MNLKLHRSKIKSNAQIVITGSKSETNRLLLLQALYPEIQLKNTSNSDDSEVMMKTLTQVLEPTTHNPQPTTIDVHHAGTSMRFLTAYFAVQPDREIVLTGSSRMKERPIKILVEALKQLGAEITYEENDGFPPIKIKGKKLTKNKVSLLANISSQYISALLLIAPKLENGLELTLEGKITSISYIKMTLALLGELGVTTTFVENKITVNSQLTIHNSQFTIESDWSSASYFYSVIALSELGTQIMLSYYKKNSLQGDSDLAEIYKNFGVETVFENNTILLRKTHHSPLTIHNLELNNCPDIAQTIALTCLGLGVNCKLTGLQTLKIKETDRLQALKNELEKFGASVEITSESLSIQSTVFLKENVTIKTYQDHRMAMAFAPLALKTTLIIEDAEVVSKSYPDFWKDMKTCGIEME